MKKLVIHTADDEDSVCLNCDNNDIGDDFCINKCGAKHGWSGYERADFVEESKERGWVNETY